MFKKLVENKGLVSYLKDKDLLKELQIVFK